MAIKLTQDQRAAALLALYREAYSETRRYRDHEWKITGWTLAVIAGAIAIVAITEFPASIQPILKTLLSVFIVSAASYGSWHIHYAHARLTWYRGLRRRIENSLDFFKPAAYFPSDSILPEHWSQSPRVPYWEGRAHLMTWWLLIALTAIYAIIYTWIQ